MSDGLYTVGVFQDLTWAERGVAALVADGFRPESLTILAKHTDAAAAFIEATLGPPVERLELKTLGPAVARGPLLTALRGRDDELSRAGLAGAFTRAGFQPHDGYIFESLTGRGGVLVAVQSEPRAADALAKLHAYGGGNAAIGAYVGRV